MTPSGEWRAGAGAIFAWLDALLPAGFPLFTRLYAVPRLRRLADRGYAWVARNRYRLPAGPAYLEGRAPEPLHPETRRELERRLLRARRSLGY